MTAKPKPKSIELYRAKLSCKIGKDGINGNLPNVQGLESRTEWALYNLLSAVEDIAAHLEKEME